jgi:hypothetical protein
MFEFERPAYRRAATGSRQSGSRRQVIAATGIACKFPQSTNFHGQSY